MAYVPLSEAEKKILAVQLEQVKHSGLILGYQLFLAMREDANTFTMGTNIHVTQFRALPAYIHLNPTTKELIENIAQDFNQGMSTKKKGEIEQIPAITFESYTAEDFQVFLKDYPFIAYRLKKRLSQLEKNKANAKWWMDWVVTPFKDDGFIGGTLQLLSGLPPPLSDIFADLNYAGEYICQMAKLKAMQYDPDLAKTHGIARTKTAIASVATGVGAIGKGAALAGLILSGFALLPIAVVIAGFGIAVSETIGLGGAIQKLWKEWTVENKDQYPGRRWDLVAGVLKPASRALAGIAIGVAAVAATTVGLPIMLMVAATGICLSSAVSAVTEGLKLFREWPIKPGESLVEARMRRLNNVSSFVNKLAITALTAVLAITAILIVANPIGLAAAGAALLTAGIVAASLSFASFIAPKITKRIVDGWKGDKNEAVKENKNRNKKENKDKMANHRVNQILDKHSEEEKLKEETHLADRLKKDEDALLSLYKEGNQELPESVAHHAMLSQEEQYISKKEGEYRKGEDTDEIEPEKEETEKLPHEKHVQGPGHHNEEDD